MLWWFSDAAVKEFLKDAKSFSLEPMTGIQFESALKIASTGKNGFSQMLARTLRIIVFWGLENLPRQKG